jgi:putative solute:sodium symporter small subunit
MLPFSSVCGPEFDWADASGNRGAGLADRRRRLTILHPGRRRRDWFTTGRGRPMVQSDNPTHRADSPANQEAHWRKTTNLMLLHLGIWFFFGYIIHMFVVPLNKIVIPILNFPLGFYMAAQGSLIVFVVQLFMFARQQNKIDREFGYAEDE